MTNESKEILIRLECMLFFKANPYAMETKSSISTRLGRNMFEVENVIEQLTQMSIIEKYGEGDSAIFRYKEPLVKSDVSIL
ncbi:MULTISPECIES: hypothetical protein [Niallia]|uniref:Uncharacterized protein n=1 Tax=Niallia circulans TaxID=1397 RepID=A0A553SSB5_NIACI|nr:MULTISPECIES: hypothetical protein [Niallia]MCM3212932.1 hypothetical protein [Niallia taxi]TRZ39893.1 hypothetical protein CEQ21_02805 [Niallia circulans]